MIYAELSQWTLKLLVSEALFMIAQMFGSHGLAWIYRLVYFVTIHHREWDFKASFGRFFNWQGPLLPNTLIRTARKSRDNVLIRIKVHWTRLFFVFSDYDLSLVCTSQCDDAFLKCTAACSNSNCVLDCNRDSIACNDCKLKLFSIVFVNCNTKYLNIEFSMSMSHGLSRRLQ